ncbi:hypothetical protein CR513_17470, partial [Mucuna pruriens]
MKKGHVCLFNDYLSTRPIYRENQFQRRNHATIRISLSLLHKCTIVISMFTYKSTIDHVKEYVCIDKSITIEGLNKYVKRVNMVFRTKYLKRPNNNDIE